MACLIEKTDRRARIRDLNDQLRQTFVGGAVVCTPGILALPEQARTRVLQAVRTFDRFTADNDPYGEHDFGSFELDGERVFFKTDYYDRDLVAGSPDPTDPAVTTRVLTIMLASEY